MKNTSVIGARTEAKVLSALASLAFVVSVPFGVARYDFVVDTPYGFKRVQCKTGRLKNGAIQFSPCSIDRNGRSVGYEDSADYFGVYCFENDHTYLVPVSHVGKNRPATLRVDSTKSGQVKGIRWAKDYLIYDERHISTEEGNLIDLMQYGYSNKYLFQD